MKKLLLFIFFIPPLLLHSQWKYQSSGNAFDGEYKSATVIGKGGRFPYNNPVLVLNVFNSKDLNFYITKAGYFFSDEYVKVKFIIDNKSDIIYYSKISKSKNGETLFFNSFFSNEKEFISILSFLEELKKGEYVDVRIEDSQEVNDYRFSLRGSAKAINFVVDKKYNDYVKSYIESIDSELSALKEKRKQRDSLNRQLNNIIKEKKKLFQSLIKEYSLSFRDTKNLNEWFDNYSLGYIKEFTKFETLKFKKDAGSFFEVVLLDKDNVAIEGDFSIVDLPDYNQHLMNKRKQLEEAEELKERKKLLLESKKHIARIKKIINENYFLDDQEANLFMVYIETSLSKYLLDLEKVVDTRVYFEKRSDKNMIMRFLDSNNTQLVVIEFPKDVFNKKFLRKMKPSKDY